MGDREGWPQPSGLLPEKSSSFSALCGSSLEDEQWRWEEAEGRTSELISRIQPTKSSEERRKAVADYVRCLILKCFDCQVFTFGSVPLKTYLPDGDIDLTAFSRLHHLKDTWATNVRSILEAEEHKENAQFHVKEVQYIQAEVKIIKCLVENIVVDISFNQLGGICTLCFLEEVDRLIGQNHLFKRSIILVKAWCYYESRILGAHHGLISTYALETLVLYIFHVFHASLRGPLEVLFWFLEFFSNFDWDKYCVSLWGPVPLSSLPGISGMHALRSTAEPPLKDGDKLLLGDRFLEACGNQYAVCPTPNENQARTFPSKYMNVIDPLRTSNNLGRSVSKGNFFRIRSAFAYGARKLAHILQCSKDNLSVELDRFFLNTWDRHGNGGRPDAPDYVDRQLQPDFLEDSKDGNHEHSNEEFFTADVDATFFKSKIFNDAEVHPLQQSDKEGSPVFSDGSDSHSRRGAKGITTHNVVENESISEVTSSTERSGEIWQERSRHSIGENHIAATNKSDAPKDKRFPDFAGQFSSAAIPGGKGTRQTQNLALPVERQNGKLANVRDPSQELSTISFDTSPNFTVTNIKSENKPVVEALSSRLEHTEVLAGEEPLFTDNIGNVDIRDPSSRISSTTGAVPHLRPIPFVPMPVSLPISNSLRMITSIPPSLSQPINLAGPPPPPLPFRAGQPLSAFNDPVPGSGPAPPVGPYLAMQLPRGPPLSPFVGLPTLSLSANPISAPRTPLEQKHIQAPWKSSSGQLEDLDDQSSSGVTQQPDVGMHHEISVASFHPPAVIRPYQSSHNGSMAIERSTPIPWNGTSAEDNETEDGGNWEDDLENEQLQTVIETEGFQNGELSGGYADQSYGKDRVKDAFSEALTGTEDVSVSFTQSWGIQNAVEPSILGIDGYPLMHSPASNIAPSDANSTSGSSVGGESSAFASFSSPHVLLGQRTGVQSQSTFIRPDRWQRTTDKQGLSSFYYSTNAPLAYVPMYPLYFIQPPDGAVGIGGLPATHTLDALSDGTAFQFIEDGQFIAPFSRGVGERLIADGIPVTAGPRGSMPFDSLSEGTGVHDSRFDLLTSDFAGHLRNLDYARFCQSPLCQSPPPFIPFYIQPQKEYQGHHLPEGPGRPVQMNSSFSKHTMGPHGPGRVGGGYHRNFEDLPKQHGGTGTYLPGMRHNAYRGGGRSQQDNFQDRNDYSERDYVPPPRYRAMGRGQKFEFRGEKAGQSSKLGEKGWEAQRSENLRRNSVQAFPVAFTSPNSAGTPLYVLPPYSTAGNEPLKFGSLESLQFGAIQVSDDSSHHGHGRQPEDSTFPVPGERQPPSPRHQSRSTQRAYQLKEEDFPPLSFRGQRGNNSATSSNRGTHYQAYVESRT